MKKIILLFLSILLFASYLNAQKADENELMIGASLQDIADSCTSMEGSVEPFVEDPNVTVMLETSVEEKLEQAETLGLTRKTAQSTERATFWAMISAIIAGIASIIALLSILIPIIDRWKKRPKLELSMSLEHPEHNYTRLSSGEPCHYFRFRVVNKGVSPALKIQLYLEKVVSIIDKSEIETTSFFPMNLVWSYNHTIIADNLPSKIPNYCDFFRIANLGTNSVLQTSTENTTKQGTGVVNSLGFNTYRFYIRVGGENFETSLWTITIRFLTPDVNNFEDINSKISIIEPLKKID